MLIFNGSRHKTLVSELQIEKQDLQSQIEALQSDYDSLSSDYEFINAQLDSSREEIAQLVERVKTVSATNRSKIRQYEKELGTLRSIMRSYIVQIDSLNHLNHKLTAEAAPPVPNTSAFSGNTTPSNESANPSVSVLYPIKQPLFTLFTTFTAPTAAASGES